MARKINYLKLLNLHIFLAVQIVMEYRTSAWFWNLVSVEGKTMLEANPVCLVAATENIPLAGDVIYTCVCQSNFYLLSRHGCSPQNYFWLSKAIII